MKLMLHADDYGLTQGTTEDILRTVDEANITGVSLIPNGDAFDYAVSELKKRPHLRIGVHLNLVEFPSVCLPAEIPLLVDKEGHLQNSFQSLWATYLLGSRQTKDALRNQVKREICAQISRVAQEFPGTHLDINGHQHLHMVPFVFDVIMELSERFPIRYVRIPDEPRVWTGWSWDLVHYYVSLNPIKHVVLKTLSPRCRRSLAAHRIETSDFFVGVLYSGHMSENIVRRMIRRIAGEESTDASVEILFHPGRAVRGKESHLASRQKESVFYFSSWREREQATLLSASFSQLISESGKRLA